MTDPPSQRHLVRTPAALRRVASDRLARALHPTRIGCFERVGNHEVRRRGGLEPLALLCLEGAGWIEANGRRRRVRAGMAAWVDCRRPHAYGSDPHQPWSIAWMHLGGPQIAAWEARLTDAGHHRVWRAGHPTWAHAAFEEAWQMLESGADDVLVGLACGRWLAALDRRARQGVAPAASPEKPVDGIARALREHPAARVNLKELARQAKCSPGHLLASFRARWGCPPRHYQIRQRLQLACMRLETTTRKVAVIAEEVGYANPFYFSRLFNRVFGLSPTRYRRRHQLVR